MHSQHLLPRICVLFKDVFSLEYHLREGALHAFYTLKKWLWNNCTIHLFLVSSATSHLSRSDFIYLSMVHFAPGEHYLDLSKSLKVLATYGTQYHYQTKEWHSKVIIVLLYIVDCNCKWEQFFTKALITKLKSLNSPFLSKQNSRSILLIRSLRAWTLFWMPGWANV